MELKDYQKKRLKCKFVEDKPKTGLWCNNLNSKCCFENCKRVPLISCGKSNDDCGGVVKKGVDGVDELTKREFEALRYYNQKQPLLTMEEIADRMIITKQRVSFLIQKAKKKLGIGVDNKAIRLTRLKGGVDNVSSRKRHKLSWHAEEVTVDIEPIELVAVKLVKWSNTEYWRNEKDTDLYHIQVFRNKIKVTFKREIEGFERERVKLEAEKRCKNFLSNINRFLNRHGLKGKVVLKDKGRYLRVKRHWAIKGTGLAKKLRKEKENLYVYDRETGELLLYFDKSDVPGHIETDNIKKGDVVVDKTQRVFDEYLHDDVPTPKETLDMILGLHKTVESMGVRYAENINSHLAAISELRDIMREIKDDLKKKK
jgi:DNA-binding CsgD family transcriptional regulator